MIRIAIIDDHPLFRKGLLSLLDSTPDIRAVGEAGNLNTARDLLTSQQPDVALLDVNLGRESGLELIDHCRAQTRPISAVLLTLDQNERIFEFALGKGASGYVLKENAPEEVLLAIRTAASGGFYCSSSLRAFMGRREEPIASSRRKHPLANLTPTERRVLRMVGANRTSKEIASELCISPRTVESHRANICERLSLKGAQVLLRFALEHRAEI
jgi:DNA-binding NarL/FixJ family response regulator